MGSKLAIVCRPRYTDHRTVEIHGTPSGSW